MIKICAIIAEYNPLHDGHIYHIKKARELSGCDTILCLMSGNFVQRGEPAIVDKYFRARQAVLAGADIVVELPAPYALSSAQHFAFYAVKMLSRIKPITHLSFGMEADEIAPLENAAAVLSDENAEFKENLYDGLKSGDSYAKSYCDAAANAFNTCTEQARLLLSPNNILAIEYLKAIKKQNANIIPVGIKRLGAGFLSDDISIQYPSAFALRKSLKNNEIKKIKNNQKNELINDLIEYYLCNKTDLLRLSTAVLFRCRTNTLPELKAVYGANEGLENLLKEKAGQFDDFNALLEALISRRYTRSKMSRFLMNILLEITKEKMQKYYKINPYYNILALNKNKEKILNYIPDLLTNFDDINRILKTDCAELLQTDMLASEIYNFLCHKPTQPFVKKLQKI